MRKSFSPSILDKLFLTQFYKLWKLKCQRQDICRIYLYPVYRSLKQFNSKILKKKLKQLKKKGGQISIWEDVQYYLKKTENKTEMGWWGTGKKTILHCWC